MNAHQRFILLMFLALIGLVNCAQPAQQLSRLPTAVANLPLDTTAGAHVSPTTVDATATFAIHLIETALASTPDLVDAPTVSSTPMPTATPSHTATMTPVPQPTLTLAATPDPALAQTALAQSVATAIAATLTAQPTATPNVARTQTTIAQQMATSVAATLTAQATPTPTAPPINRASAVVDADGKLNLRAGPDTSFNVLAQLNTGETITILGRLASASWVQIQTATGITGWVAAGYIKSAAPLDTYPVVTPPSPPVVPPTPIVSCAYAVAPAFTGRWSQSETGCAVGPSQITWASFNVFERGYMIWRRDTDTLYIFYNNGQWQAMPDKWDGVTEPSSRGAPPPGLQAPIRGAGWVWGSNDMVFQGLGWATDKQKGFCAEVQTFAQGFLLRSSTVEFCHEEKLYNFAREGGFGVLFLKALNTGYWQR